MPVSARWAREAMDFGEEPWTRPNLVRQVGPGVATLMPLGKMAHGEPDWGMLAIVGGGAPSRRAPGAGGARWVGLGIGSAEDPTA